MKFWEAGLNPEQKKAVLRTEGPSLILAGAGSGKTKTLTHRIAYLIAERAVSPNNILAVTFTNKAAGEMRDRVEALLALAAEESESPLSFHGMPHIGTFHAISAKILRNDIAKLGRDPRFNILDADDQISIVKAAMKGLDMSEEQIKPRSVLEAISRAKGESLDADTYALRTGSYYEELVAKVYKYYESELLKTESLDFDDLLRLTVRLFEESPETLVRYQDQFRYVLVDEYQDTNPLQYRLIRLLALKHHNVFVIGDDYQSIYRWRQADIRNILEFEKDYPDAQVITLERNYRSTQIILDAAGSVIAKNRNQREKKLWTEEKEGDLIVARTLSDEAEEAEFVARTIKHSGDDEESIRFGDFAALYRTNAQSRALEEAFLRYSIPYRIVGGLKFYQRKEVKDVISYARLLMNPRDMIALSRIINEPKRGIGKATLVKWADAAERAGTDPLSAVSVISPEYGIPEKKILIMKTFASLFSRLRAEVVSATPTLTFSEILKELATESGYLLSLRDGTGEGEERELNVRELFSVAKKYEDRSLEEALQAFLEEVALSSDTDSIDNKAEAVHLMTLHSAKGLEFPTVFIVGLEEGVFPHSRSAFSEEDLEEERRLMYVGITRAKKRLYLLSAEARMLFGSTNVNPTSRFIGEIPSHLLEEVVEEERPSMLAGYGRKRIGKRDVTFGGRKPSGFQSSASRRKESTGETVNENVPKEKNFRPGDNVEHPEFGGGIVISISGTIATIAFKRVGVKKLMLGMAPLKKA
ncbi:MAG: UvrD-helicase domain-containing protein [Candidatus Moranbacteria bacterium]|nr:UvrD-helicase domain-containing protein [Candidatus Moranbacteria bacterium]